MNLSDNDIKSFSFKEQTMIREAIMDILINQDYFDGPFSKGDYRELLNKINKIWFDKPIHINFK